ncbi:hypothetical protein [Nocardioides aurantiacus]|uniref:Uncharacterized protein n=1 Tax=Nocardioides aurantiacus TaxID=86796 RepID=A0A3N2D0Q1_9ACTN|nr:hypothetical protein [Nocardioides aurantiacus]ROR93044.1 hypothetical protein EDD33_3949 [Nocardioides aurantiacus]
MVGDSPRVSWALATWVVPYALGLSDTAAWVAWVAGPALGLLLFLPGTARHLGTGLVASALTLPLLLLALLVVGAFV